MNETIHSYFLFGGSFFTKLLPHLQTKGMIAGQLSGISPLSEISLSTQRETPVLSYWLPELDADLAAVPADYFVLDLQLALTKLLSSEAGFISASAENLEQLTRPEVAIVDPILLPTQTVTAALNRLSAVITKYFPSNRIILIHTHNSPFWLAGNSLRAEVSPAADPVHANWLKDLEQQFREITGCHFVDITRFYFYQKEIGKPLTNVIYEESCYPDVARCIFDIAHGGSGNPQRPDFASSLDRYANFYFSLHTKPQRVFLDATYFLDRLVLSSSDTFVRKYRQELIELNLLDWREPAKALAFLNKFNSDSDLTRICVAFDAICNGDYHNPHADYGLMFRSEVVPEAVVAYLKKEYAPKADLIPSQINRDNAGFHFARMTKQDPALFSTEKTVATPSIIDVFGSCISRTPFNVRDNDFAVNNYWFHVPPFESRNQPVPGADGLFPAKLNWKERLVKQQFECGVYQKIMDSTSEWLVLDLYSLVSPNNFYYQNCLYGDFDHSISARLKAKRVMLTKEPNPIGSQDAVIAALDPWLEVIKKKYGKKIIMIDVQRFQHWIGDDDLIYTLPSASPSNAFLARAARHVRSKTDCYQISVGKFFLPEESGYLRNTPTHMEDAGYLSVHDIARYIVDHEPDRKVFDQYSGHLHMTHLERLAKRNDLATLNKALPLTELDKAVVRLGYETMRTWHDQLAALYDQVDWTLPLAEALAAYPSDSLLVRALTNAAKLPFSQVTIPTNYTHYPDNGLIVGGFTGNCKLPDLPAVAVKTVENAMEAVALNWTCPAGTTVRVYRQEAGMPWILIGTSDDGKFRDQTVMPLTDYRYCLCSEVTHGSRCYFGSFTAPVAIRTAPATPLLISAVHLDGNNTLRWASVPGAAKYGVYHKPSPEHKWQLSAIVPASGDTCFTEPSRLPAGGEWYTVRAVGIINGKDVAGGFQSGLQATPL